MVCSALLSCRSGWRDGRWEEPELFFAELRAAAAESDATEAKPKRRPRKKGATGGLSDNVC